MNQKGEKMIDIYSIIAVGSAFALGIIPLIKQIKTRDTDFLLGHSINKSLMTEAEKEECLKLGYTAFMKKVEKESKERKKNKISY